MVWCGSRRQLSWTVVCGCCCAAADDDEDDEGATSTGVDDDAEADGEVCVMIVGEGWCV